MENTLYSKFCERVKLNDYPLEIQELAKQAFDFGVAEGTLEMIAFILESNKELKHLFYQKYKLKNGSYQTKD